MNDSNGPTKYVIGFMYVRDTRQVVMIRKNRPEWQAGRLNGVGGHIEPGESARAAMVREFQEETGMVTTTDDWTLFLRIESNHNTHMTVFAAIVESESRCPVAATTDEIVNIVPVDRFTQLWPDQIVPNMSYIVPMGWHHITHGALDVSVIEHALR